jgi:opacity protein-like surface antigen
MAVLLPYLSAGVAYDGDQTAATWGAGFDYAVTDRIFTGVSYDAVPDWDTEVLAVRVGFKF